LPTNPSFSGVINLICPLVIIANELIVLISAFKAGIYCQVLDINMCNQLFYARVYIGINSRFISGHTIRYLIPGHCQESEEL
jgi:hypothetical protein